MPSPAGLPAEIAFLAEHGIPDIVLRQAAARARREKVSAERILIAYEMVDDDRVYRSLAAHLGLPFVKHWPRIALPVDPTAAVAAGRVRLAGEGSKILTAPSGEALRTLLAARARGLPLGSIAITTPAHLSRLILHRAGAEMARAATHALPDAAPNLSARGAFDRKVGIPAALAVGASLLGGGFDWHLVTDLLGLVFLAGMVMRLLVCAAGLGRWTGRRPTLCDADAPTYSVLIALYHEPAIAPELIAALKRLDYPRGKLEILLLLECDDVVTRDALHAEGLPPYMRIVVVPDGSPRTKPRALNVGLTLARGALVTVYDAEDRPEPDQLRKAAQAFASAPDDVACLQARLTIRNGADGLLPKMFAIEYAGLFDVFNVGIARLGLPMALGGTSNHFKASVLRQVGAWDAWNVTEDADLGLRLARFGYATRSLASSTTESAPEDIGVWFKQRRRWMKGWMQTLVVLARDPGVWRDFGPGRSLLVALLLTNLVTGPLALPVFQTLLVVKLASFGLPSPQHAGQVIEAALAVSVLTLGIFATLWCGYQGVRHRGLERFLPALPLLFVYQLMISAATWGGLFDLVRKPYHWHKTEHGAAKSKATRAAPSCAETGALAKAS